MTRLIDDTRRQNHRLAEAEADAEEQRTKEVNDIVKKTLLTIADSWFTGINKNVPGNRSGRFSPTPPAL